MPDTGAGLTAAELELERAAQAEALPLTATTYAKGGTTDATGGTAPTYPTARATGIAARLGDPTGLERELADRITTSSTKVLTLEWGAVLEATDRVTVAGTTYEVRALLTVPGYGTAVRAIVEAVS